MPNNAQVNLTLTSTVAPQIAATANAYKTLSAEEKKAEQAATAYAQALTKVALADAKTATEEQRLAVQTANAAKAQTQAEQAALRLANAQQKSASGSSYGAQTADAFKSSLLGIVGPAALAGAAIAALKGAADLTVAGEGINRVSRSFESLAVQAHTSGDAILTALRSASGGEISDLNLQLATNKGLLLGVASSAQQFSDLMVIARDRAAKLGTTTAQAFDDITTGIGRESPRILDNLGIIVDAKAANEAYAASIGKSVDQLTKQERITALTNAVVAQGKAGLDASTTAINDQTNAYARLAVAAENQKNRLGGFLATQSQVTAGRFADILSIDGSSAAYAKAGVAAQNLVGSIGGIPPMNAQSQKTQEAWLKAIFDFDEEARVFLGIQRAIGPVVAQNTALFDEDRIAIGKVQIATKELNDKNSEFTGKIPVSKARERENVDSLTPNADKRAADQAARLQDARDSLALSRAKTTAQKIAELRRQQAASDDPVKKLQLQQQIEQEQRSGSGRVSAAQSTALKLSDIARSSGDDRARIERENQEKLRDAQQDFDVRSTRAQEDYEEKRRRLLAQGQRGQAAQLAADFAKEQRRAKEDFDRERGRTIRNANEALGDQGTRVGDRVESIAARTQARGGVPSGLPSAGGGGGLPGLPSAAPAQQRAGAQAVAQINLYLDGKKFAEAIWAPLEPIVDQELSVSLQQIGAPGSGQSAIAGPG